MGSTTLPDLPPLGSTTEDREFFRANTVYFDYDRSEIRGSERSKINDVATYLKDHPAENMLIEGHCDERGTEGYNLSLGERRALAVREYLMNSGVSGDRVRTLSWGEDRPVDLGHNEAAWAKNRRAEFVIVRGK